MDERNNGRAASWWRVWLNEITSAQPDVTRASAAAKQLVAYNPSRAQLRQWLAAIAGHVDDALTCEQSQAQLPDFLMTQMDAATSDGPDSARFADLRNHLALCPFCTEAYAQSAEWLLASLRDEVPAASVYPTFHFSFLTKTPTSLPTSVATMPAVAARLHDAIDAGKRWLDDAAGGFFLLFGPNLQSQPAVAWATKSAAPGSLLAQMVLTEEEIASWEVTVAAFAQEGAADLCEIEVALFRTGVTLQGIAVALSTGSDERRAETDSSGVVTFDDVPLAQLPQVVVHIALSH